MIRVAINGFGRIGRLVMRAGLKQGGIDFVAVNDIADSKTLAHLFKYDSVHGRYDGKVEAGQGYISIDGRRIRVTAERNPENLPWKELDVDIVIESTGRFRAVDDARKHIDAGAKKVIISAPGKGDLPSVVLGVNDDDALDASILDNASCTTNCLAPIVHVLEKEFGIEKGLMTTIHGYTSDQRILDLPHSDLRRARAAAVNIIPTTTGAAKAVGKVLPDMKGRLDGMAIRVPVPDGSLVDLVAVLKKDVTKEQINAAMKRYAEGELEGILEYSEDPLVSTDIIGNPSSSVFDAGSTMVTGGNLVKVLSWYDNEWGYSNRIVGLVKRIA